MAYEAMFATHVCKPYPYEHIQMTEHLIDLEISEVTIDASLSTGAPLTT
jgi:hypothetical protein